MILSCSSSSSSRVDAQPVRRRRHLAGRARDRHAGEVVDRAARTDAHARRAAHDIGDERFERRADVLFEPLAFALRRRVLADELGGEAADAERRRSRPTAARQPSPIISSTLPPPMSMPSAGAGSITTLARTAAKISRASSSPLITSTSTSASVLDAVDEFAAVVGGADGARRLGEHLGRAERVGELLHRRTAPTARSATAGRDASGYH